MIGEILAKLGRREALTSEEQSRIRIWGNNAEFNDAYLLGLQNGQSKINISSVDFPIVLLYGNTFVVDTAFFTVSIPSIYRHLLFLSNGRTTAAGTGGQLLGATVNGDTGANYSYQFLSGTNTTVAAAGYLAVNDLPVGTLAGSGNPANESVSSVAFLPNYKSSLFKGSVVLNGLGGSAQSDIYAESGSWRSTDQITTLKIQTFGSIAAGTSISIYGLL